jgi:nitrile hydratase
MRYMVLPMRPDGAEHLSEAELAELVNRDCLVGTRFPEPLRRPHGGTPR